MRQRGFTYLGLLFFVAILGVSLALTGVVWHTVQKREKEKELLFIGQQYRQAIATYYNRSPGTTKQYPKTLEDLLKDPRHLATQRYLRKLYADPITGKYEWGLIKTHDDRIMGVYSQSEDTPLKQGNFREAEKEFEAKSHYYEWQFIYRPPQPTAQAVPLPVPAPRPVNMQPDGGLTAMPERMPPVAPISAAPGSAEETSSSDQQLCEILQRNDLGVCANIAGRFGEEAGRECSDSAAERYSQCQEKGMKSLPPLNVRFN